MSTRYPSAWRAMITPITGSGGCGMYCVMVLFELVDHMTAAVSLRLANAEHVDMHCFLRETFIGARRGPRRWRKSSSQTTRIPKTPRTRRGHGDSLFLLHSQSTIFQISHHQQNPTNQLYSRRRLLSLSLYYSPQMMSRSLMCWAEETGVLDRVEGRWRKIVKKWKGEGRLGVQLAFFFEGIGVPRYEMNVQLL